MEGVTLKSRAIVFAISAGAVAFILALVATSGGRIDLENIARAMIPAIVCGTMCWAAAERSIAAIAAALDAAIGRLAEAAHGDLDAAIPPGIAENLPELATAMEGLFQHLGANLARVNRLALFDSITGLPNRTNFRQSCEHSLGAMKPDQQGALLFIDLDRFKAVNDMMGHAMGDVLLGLVAERLREVGARIAQTGGAGQPLIGRLSGDEFTMFFAHDDDRDGMARIGREVLAALAVPFDLGGTEIVIGASIGIALRPQHATGLSDLMRAADAAMYLAKASGRGRAELFSDVLADGMAERALLERDLRAAIARDEFALVFQPQVTAFEGRIVAAEALLRWHHPRDGVRPPDTFLHCAEETGMIVELGEWVMCQVARTIANWGRAGIEQRLAVNVSPRQIDHVDFFRRLRAAMQAANAPARLLELEVSETLVMQCSYDVIEAIAQLRADGATISIDDFGTGYSNLARLRALPIDRIKLDPSLIERVAEDHAARAIAHAVIGLVHGLGCETVAEGVETQAQADVLRILGCDVLQGFAIAAPMDEAAFIAWSRVEEHWVARA